MTSDYWAHASRMAVDRRRALSAAGGAAAAAALLAACGGGGGSAGSKPAGASLISPVEDTTKQAKRGGVNKWFLASEPSTLDVQIVQPPLPPIKNHIYARLVAEKPGYLAPAEFKELAPELAESWEWSPDRLQLTLKLRQNVKWHNKPPVNGRTLDVQDVVFTWDRFIKVGSNRTGFANVANPDAPILSITSVDARTFVMKLKEPTSYILTQFGASAAPCVIPKETDSTFDIKSDMIGAGPFVLQKYEPSVQMTFTRHPEWWEKDRPFIDEVRLPFILEYPTGLSQFKAGNLYTYAVKNADVLTTKQDVPDLRVYQRAVSNSFAGSGILFGLLPAGGSPFRDERVRQAVSMSIDRDLYLETLGNASGFKKEGLPVDTKWHSALGSTSPFWWLDPKGKDFGPNAKFYQHDIAEVKRLLTAAGYPNGLNLVSHFGSAFGIPESEVIDGMLADAGIRSARMLMETGSEYPKYRDGNGQFEGGWAYVSGGSYSNDPVGFLTWRYSTKGGQGFLGFDANGRADRSGDPQVESLIAKANSELDAAKQQALVQDIQRYLAKAQYELLNPGLFSGFSMAWPALRNFMVLQGGSRWDNKDWWIDETQPPFKKA
jgi:peptide/nickel transport system substrate-binding protein